MGPFRTFRHLTILCYGQSQKGVNCPPSTWRNPCTFYAGTGWSTTYGAACLWGSLSHEAQC
eukprot:6187-Eustigmatos_ZCMA.PRE.1